MVCNGCGVGGSARGGVHRGSAGALSAGPPAASSWGSPFLPDPRSPPPMQDRHGRRRCTSLPPHLAACPFEARAPPQEPLHEADGNVRTIVPGEAGVKPRSTRAALVVVAAEALRVDWDPGRH
jgi:hypothetical protein